MKILCSVFNKPAVVVGYGPGRKGRPLAIVMTEGKLKAVRLKDVVVDKDSSVVALQRRKA